MTGPDVIRISFGPETTDSFKQAALEAIQEAIKTVSDQHFGRPVTEAEVEICMGKLFSIKWQLERCEKGDKAG